MTRLAHHVFVCLNDRAEGDPRGCCAAKGAAQILDLMKGEIHRLGLNKQIRVQRAGCLDHCEQGVSIVIYPEGVWYGHVTAADAMEIVEKHLLGGEPVARLRTDRA